MRFCRVIDGVRIQADILLSGGGACIPSTIVALKGNPQASDHVDEHNDELHDDRHDQVEGEFPLSAVERGEAGVAFVDTRVGDARRGEC